MDDTTPQMRNDTGAADLPVGVKAFECIGATPPHDHPHIYLDMGAANEIVCPYCSTRYRYDPNA